MSAKKDKLIYIIDDDAVMRLSCRQILVKDGYQTETFEDGEQGLNTIEKKKPHLLVVDLKMPKIGGMEVISRVHQIDPGIVIIVFTGYATVDTAVEAMKAGAYDFLPKPFTPDELRLIVNRGLEKQELAEESNRLRLEKDKLQRQIITFVSHQLQSPLVAIQQYFDVLKHLGDAPNKAQLQEQWIDRSLIKIKELLELIRDWLRISKIESGAIAEKIKIIDLLPILRDIYQNYERQVESKALKFLLTIPRMLSQVKGDDECLKVVISNLVENAIKYNRPHGSIHLSASEDSEFIQISVSDTGIGIAKENFDFIFEEFHRVKDDTTKDIPGTGLGLPICQKIIAELGGKITLDSKINEGSTFTLNLPICRD